MKLEKEWIIDIIAQMNHNSINSINGMLHPDPLLISRKQFLKELKYALSDNELYCHVHKELLECNMRIISFIFDYLGYTYDKNGAEWEDSESNL